MKETQKEEKGKNLPAISQGIDILQRFDELDDKAIISELENRVVDAWVYHFKPRNAPEVWGIGKAGIDGCVMELGKNGIALREEDIKYAVDPTNSQYVLFTAKVSKHFIDKSGAEAMIETSIGTKRQWTRMLLRNGDAVADPFWFEKGSIKALRNAKARLIPEDIKAKIITFAKTKGKVKEIKEDNGFARKTKREKGELMSQEQSLKIAKLENTLVDKFGIMPEELLTKMKKEIGADAELENLTEKEAGIWIRLLEIRVKNEEKKAVQ